MKNKQKNHNRWIAALVLTLSLTATSGAWAAPLGLKASKIATVFVGDEGAPSIETVFIIRNADATWADPAQNPSYCYNRNDATYELRLERSNPYYKELMAIALASYVANKPVSVTTRDESCSIRIIGLTP